MSDGFGDDTIPVLSEAEYTERLARRIYDANPPQYTGTVSTEGAVTGPTRLTWETEDESRREWCRAKAREVIEDWKRTRR